MALNLQTDISDLAHRKRQGLLDMTRIMRSAAASGAQVEMRQRLGTFSVKLERNRAVLGTQLRAVREIADIISHHARLRVRRDLFAPHGTIMKVFLVGCWVALVALGTAYGVAVYMPSSSGQAKAAASTVLQSQKTRVINVPHGVGRRGARLHSVEFVFTTDSNLAKTLQVSPEVYLLDEAFRTIYADSAIYLNHDEKYDLQKLTAHLVESTNAHLGMPMIKDVLIENFQYIDKDIGKT